MYFEQVEVEDESGGEDAPDDPELAREIEREFGVVLTHDAGGRDPDGRPADHVVWRRGELLDLREVLLRLPPSALGSGPDRVEFRRSKANYYRGGDGVWVRKNDAGAYRSGVVRIFDASIGDRQDHAGDTSELAGFDAAHPIRAMQQTLVHELGHAVEGAEGVARFHAAVGWREEQGEGAAAGLRETRRKGVAADRRVYVAAGDQVFSYVKGQLPEGGAHSGGVDPDTWDYARSQPREYFAECYSKAILVPELLHEDLIVAPARRAEAIEDRDAMARQWAALRAEVFHLTDADVERGAVELAARCVARGRSADVVSEFRAKAARAMTHEQLARLAALLLGGS